MDNQDIDMAKLFDNLQERIDTKMLKKTLFELKKQVEELMLKNYILESKINLLELQAAPAPTQVYPYPGVVHGAPSPQYYQAPLSFTSASVSLSDSFFKTKMPIEKDDEEKDC